jgi:hypothetical protein
MFQASSKDPSVLIGKRKRTLRRAVKGAIVVGLIALAVYGVVWVNRGECIRSLLASAMEGEAAYESAAPAPTPTAPR